MSNDNEDYDLLKNIPIKEACIDDEKLEILIREVKLKSEKIKDIYNGFVVKGNNDYSLIELYMITDQSLNLKDTKYRYFNSIRKSELFQRLNRNDALNIVNEINNNLLLKTYFKYKKFLNNHAFNIVKDNTELKDLELAVSKISGLLNNSFALLPPIYNNKYTKSFIDNKIFFKNPSDAELLELVQKINREQNGYIINKYEKKSNSIVQWIKNAIKREKRLKDYSEYKSLENEIFSQYKENIECLKIFIKSFNFLQKVIQEEAYKKMHLYVLNEEEFSVYLQEIRNKLQKYINFLKLKESIEKLPEEYKELLEFIYTNVESMDEGYELSQFILEKYYYYYYISNMEYKNWIINEYDKIQDYYDSLLKSIEYIIKSSSVEKSAKSIVNELFTQNNNNNNNNNQSAVENTYIKEVLKLLDTWGYTVKKDYLLGEYLAEYVIFNKENEENFIILSFDNNQLFGYNQLKKALYFKMKNYNIYNLWSRNWWGKRSSEIIRLRAMLTRTL